MLQYNLPIFVDFKEYILYVSRLDEAKQADLLKFPSQNLVIKHDLLAIATELIPYSLYPVTCDCGE